MTNKIQSNLTKLAFSLACISITGCTTINTKIATANIEVPDSVFIDSSFSVDPNDYLKHLEKIKPFSKKVTTDKAAEWYVDIDDKNSLICYVGSKYNQITKTALNKGSGLLQPVYSMSENGRVEPDWEKTEQLRTLLISKFKLDILGVSVSKQYQEKLVEYLTKSNNEKRERVLNNILQPQNTVTIIAGVANMGKTIDAMKDEMARSGPDYVAKSVLENITIKPSYFIETSTLFNDSFTASAYTLDHNDYLLLINETAKKYPQVKSNPTKMAENLKLMQEQELIGRYKSIKQIALYGSVNTFMSFKPLDYYTNITQAGYSLDVNGLSCGFESIENAFKAKKSMNDMMGYGAIPIVMAENAKTLDQQRQEATVAVRASIESRAMLESNFIDRVIPVFDAFKIAGRTKSMGLDSSPDTRSDFKSTSDAPSSTSKQNSQNKKDTKNKLSKMKK